MIIVSCSPARTVCYEDCYEECYEERYEDNRCHTSNNNCVIEAIKLINKLQQRPEEPEKDCSNCDKPYLGYHVNANTRPVILYLENGKPFEVIYLDQIGLDPTPIFRIEEVKGTCATLRLLAYESCPDYPNQKSHGNQLIATKTCVTIDLNAIKAIQCLEDVHLNLRNC